MITSLTSGLARRSTCTQLPASGSTAPRDRRLLALDRRPHADRVVLGVQRRRSAPGSRTSGRRSRRRSPCRRRRCPCPCGSRRGRRSRRRRRRTDRHAALRTPDRRPRASAIAFVDERVVVRRRAGPDVVRRRRALRRRPSSCRPRPRDGERLRGVAEEERARLRLELEAVDDVGLDVAVRVDLEVVPRGRRERVPVRAGRRVLTRQDVRDEASPCPACPGCGTRRRPSDRRSDPRRSAAPRGGSTPMPRTDRRLDHGRDGGQHDRDHRGREHESSPHCLSPCLLGSDDAAYSDGGRASGSTVAKRTGTAHVANALRWLQRRTRGSVGAAPPGRDDAQPSRAPFGRSSGRARRARRPVGARRALRPRRPDRVRARSARPARRPARRGRRAGGVPGRLAHRRGVLAPSARRRPRGSSRSSTGARSTSSAASSAGAPSRSTTRAGGGGEPVGRGRRLAPTSSASASRRRCGSSRITQREAIELAYYGGFTQSELAERLGAAARYHQEQDVRRARPFARAPGRQRQGGTWNPEFTS